MYNTTELNDNVMVSEITIWIDFRYIPYNIQNTKPVQYIKYIVRDNPETSFVLIDFIACGKKAIVVHVQHIQPIISPIIGFMILFLSLFASALYKSAKLKSSIHQIFIENLQDICYKLCL